MQDLLLLYPEHTNPDSTSGDTTTSEVQSDLKRYSWIYPGISHIASCTSFVSVADLRTKEWTWGIQKSLFLLFRIHTRHIFAVECLGRYPLLKSLAFLQPEAQL